MSDFIAAVDVHHGRNLRYVEPVDARKEGGEIAFSGSRPGHAVDLDTIAGRQDRRLVEQSVGRIGEPVKRCPDLGVRERESLADLDPGGRMVDPERDERRSRWSHRRAGYGVAAC